MHMHGGFKTGQGTAVVTSTIFPVIRLTSGQENVSGTMDRIIIGLSPALRPKYYV
jgi:hypothetical protein